MRADRRDRRRAAALVALGAAALLATILGMPAAAGGPSGGWRPPSTALVVGLEGVQRLSLEAPPGVDVEHVIAVCNAAEVPVSIEAAVAGRPPEVRAFNLTLPPALEPHACAPASVRLRLDAAAREGSYLVAVVVTSRALR